MNTAPPASSSRMRLLNRDRYFYAQLATDPHQAATSCADYWVSTGARNGTPGMREQLASHGWIGTELVTGSYARHFAMSSFFDEIPIIGLFPSLAPRSIKRARQERTRIIIAARACSVGGRPASELWCFDGNITSLDPMVTNAFMDTALRDLAIALHKQGTLLGTPKRFFGGDLPKDHLFYFRSIALMRRAAKKEAKAKRGPLLGPHP